MDEEDEGWDRTRDAVEPPPPADEETRLNSVAVSEGEGARPSASMECWRWS